MTDDTSFDIEYTSSPALKVLMGREPVLNRDQNLIGYEIVFRSTSPDPARQQIDTRQMLEQVAEVGMENLAGSGLGFITATTDFLEGESVLFLPHKNFIIILPSGVEPSEALCVRISELKHMGFKFALDQYQLNSPNAARLLPLAEFIRIDLPPPPQIFNFDLEQLRLIKVRKMRILAQNVQDITQFEHCMKLGFDFFSGNFYTHPVFREKRKFSAGQLTIMKTLELLQQDADDHLIEQTIKHDATIGFAILKHFNSAASGVTQRIGSLKQAMQIVGRAQLTKWLQVMLYEKSNGSACGAALFVRATERAELLELLARKLHPTSKIAPDIAFMVGLMSLMDTLFGLPMAEVLENILVYTEVKQALLERKGNYGQLLQLVVYLEQLAQPEPPLEQVSSMLQQLNLPLEELYALQQQAFLWVNQLS